MVQKKLLTVYIITFVVAACSILYELLLANTLSLMAGSTVIWYSVTIGAYLGAMGIGAFAKSKIFSEKSPASKLFSVEIILTFLGASAAAVILFSHALSVYLIAHDWGQLGVAMFFVMGLFMIFAVGFFSGIELPLLMEIGNSINSGTKKITNRVLGADYFGSLVGALLFPLFLLPAFGSHQIGFLVAMANLTMAVMILRFYQTEKRSILPQTTAAVLLLVLLLVGFARSAQIEQYFAKKYYYYLDSGKNLRALFSAMKSFPTVERIESSYQLIDIMEPTEFSPSDILVNAYVGTQEEEEIIDERMLFLNGDWQWATYTEQIYHEYFAHVPLGVSKEIPKKILVLGGGDGMLIRELIKYNEVEHIVQVELDEKMIELAKSHPVLSKANKRALFDERVEILIGDAYHFVQNTDEKFDAVFVDFPKPADYNTSKIYSREFYSFVGEALEEKGFVVMDAPGIGAYTEFDTEGEIITNEEKSPWFHYYHTLRAAGFESVIPYLSTVEVENAQANLLANVLIGERESNEGEPKKSPIEIDQELIDKARQRKVDKMIREHVLNLQEGFIIFRKKRVYELKPVKHDVETIVNFMRLHLAFSASFTKHDEVDWSYVNSIMRPTLPNSSPWRIRFPYTIE